MGEYEKALPDMLKCAAIAIELPGQLYQIGDTLFVMGEFEKAEKVFEKVVNHPNVKSNEKEGATQYLQRIENMRQIRVDFNEDDYRVGRRV
jgi:tetratricopeptide (TPR) repeat protein